MLLIFLQHLVHHKMEAHVIILYLINASYLVFQLKHYKKEVFEIIFCFFFIPKLIFICFIFHFNNIKIFNLDAITNKNNKDDDKKWPYRMLIIGPSSSGKTNALLNLIQKQDNEAPMNQNISF